MAEIIVAKFNSLATHEDKVVRDNAQTITNAAILKRDPGLVDELARGAQEKFAMLLNHDDEMVRRYARTIMSVSFQRGNLEIANQIAAGDLGCISDVRHTIGSKRAA